MSAIRGAAAAVIVGLSATSVLAQQAAEPVPLPQVTVETSKKAAKPASKKKAVAKSVAKAAPKPAPATPAPAPDASAGAAPETATGPVKGYVATRSATGSKTDTPLLEVPRTVNVVTKDQITAQQPQSVRDALGYTPGVQNQTGASSILDTIAIRGFTAPIFLDGLLLPTDSSIGFARIRVEPYGLERLEVLKGPSSGLFGQSPPGGLINAVSKRPQDTPHGEVFIQGGTDDHRAAGFDLTGPIDPAGDVSYRLVGLARDTDLDFDFADRQRYYIAPSLTWKMSDDTKLTLLGSAQRDSGFGPFQFVNLALTKSSAPYGRISRSTYLGQPGIDDYTEDQWQVGYNFEHRFNDVFQFRQNVRYSESDQDIIAMRAFGLAADQRTVLRGINAVQAGFEGFAADNQLQADFTSGPLRHRVLAGVDYQHVDSNSGFWVNNSAPPIDAYNPNYNQVIPSPFAGANFVLSDSTLEQTGVYFQDQIKYDRWIATLGIRHDWATTDVADLRPMGVNRTLDDEKWTGSAGLSYIFDNGLAPYVNYSTSFLPVTGTTLIDTDGNPLKATTGEGYEAGVKYQPRGTKTFLAASVFQITQENVSSTLPDFSVVQTGELRTRGFELEGKSSLTENFDVLAGYTYLDPIITATLPASNIGNDFQQISRHLASAWGMYTWRDGSLAGLGLGAGVRYVGSQYAAADNKDKVPSFTVVDAALTYDMKYVLPTWEGTKLQLNALNLFDKYYVSTCQGVAFCQLGESRSFLATLKYEW